MASSESLAAPKVVVHFRATGDAPILNRPKLKIGGSQKFAKVIGCLCRLLHRETLFLYVNGAFSPNPDELVMDLYNTFGIDSKLVVNYACTMALGLTFIKTLKLTSPRRKHLSAEITLLIHGPAFLYVSIVITLIFVVECTTLGSLICTKLINKNHLYKEELTLICTVNQLLDLVPLFSFHEQYRRS